MRRLGDAEADRLVGSPEAAAQLSVTLARRHDVVPLAWIPAPSGVGGTLRLAAVRPDDPLTRESIEHALGARARLEWRAAGEGFVRIALPRVYTGAATLTTLLEHAGDRPAESIAASLLDALLLEAATAGASDLHLSPTREGTRCRLRLDGLLTERARLPIGLHEALVQRIKVLAGLDVTECRFPQDGRLMRLIDGADVAFRVSSFPVLGGENLVLRVQDPARRPGSLNALGIDDEDVVALRSLLDRPAGLLVVAGPVGSGKTTTLYALLGELDDGTRHLVTLEDPIEYPLDGIVQAAVDPARRIDLASGTRALLRQDPDVLMIGEIRDVQGCEIALRAALAGHRVLATVHADDALSSVFRLQELGASGALLAGCLRAVIAQRLIAREPPPGRFAIQERLVIGRAAREALREGGAAALARHDGAHARPRFATEVTRALERGDCTLAAVDRVFGRDDRFASAGGPRP